MLFFGFLFPIDYSKVCESSTKKGIIRFNIKVSRVSSENLRISA